MIYTGGAPGGPFENPYWYLDDPDYNAEVADLVVYFFNHYLTHTKGTEWAGDSFKLFPWQEHRIIRPLFGILREPPSEKYPNGLRRIRKAYIEICKKNGKSELIAGVGLKGLVADFEAAGEIYTAAAEREQANIIHKASSQMVRNNDELFAMCEIIRSQKRITRDDSYYQALSADVPTKHGYSPHMILFDELHAQPNSDLWDVLTKGSTKARKQPIILSITTAGYDQESICWKERERAVKILTGVIEDKEYLPVIYGMDEDEDWEDEENWKAVNPSMYWEVEREGKKFYRISWDDTTYQSVDDVPGIFSLDVFRKAYHDAKEMPYKINLWRRLRLNQWTNQDVQIIDLKEWDACGTAFSAESLRGRVCCGAFDLSLVYDLTAWALLFPEDDESVKMLLKCWLPKNSIKKAIDRDGVPYDQWIREGWIETTPGNVIDYSYFKEQVIADGEKYEIREIGYDPHLAMQVAIQLQNEGFTVVPISQSFSKFSEPTKAFLNLIRTGNFNHGNNPVAKWMASNFTVDIDVHENIRPMKAKKTKRIDGLVAAIMALTSIILNPDLETESQYETQELLIV